MNPTHSPALELALAGFRAPGLFLRLRDRPLPADVLLLLRLAAGDAQARAQACAISGESEAVVVDAAVLFIQQAMFHPGSDSHRVLGVAADAADSQLKEHHRWLLRWLHPDRNDDEWDAVYADRVNKAWQDLRTPGRRSVYAARELPTPAAASGSRGLARAPGLRATRTIPPSEQLLLSGRSVRRLPVLILGSLTLGSLAVLGLQYYLSRAELRGPAANTPVYTQTPAPGSSEAAPPSRPSALAIALALPAPRAPDALPPPITVPVPDPAPLAVPVAEAALAPAVEDPAPAPTATAMPSAPVARVATPNPPKPASYAKASAPTAGPAPANASQRPLGLPTTNAAVPKLVSPPLINEASAEEMIRRFRKAYGSGDIRQLRELLASEGVAADGERQEILRNYSQLFETSARRQIEIHDASWFTEGQTAILFGSYEAWIVPRGETKGRRYTGDIRFDLLREDGQLRIARLRHAPVGG